MLVRTFHVDKDGAVPIRFPWETQPVVLRVVHHTVKTAASTTPREINTLLPPERVEN